MRTAKIVIVAILLVVMFVMAEEICEAKTSSILSVSTLVSAFRNQQPIQVMDGVSLYVVQYSKNSKSKDYDFSLNFVAVGEVKGISLYIFSSQLEPQVQINYVNNNQWVSFLVYEPQAADQIIDEYGGAQNFPVPNYAWLIGSSFIETSNDLGTIILKTSKNNLKLRFIVEMYNILEEEKK